MSQAESIASDGLQAKYRLTLSPSSPKHTLSKFIHFFLFCQIVAVTKSRRITLYDVSSCTAICHVGLPVSFLLSSQSPCICADGKVLMLIGAQMDEENHDDLNIEASAPLKVRSHRAKDRREHSMRLCYLIHI